MTVTVPVIEREPETDTVPHPDTDELIDTDPVVVTVAETNEVGDVEEETLGVIVPDPLCEPLDVTLIVLLGDTDNDEVVQPDDDTLPD